MWNYWEARGLITNCNLPAVCHVLSLGDALNESSGSQEELVFRINEPETINIIASGRAEKAKVDSETLFDPLL